MPAGVKNYRVTGLQQRGIGGIGDTGGHGGGVTVTEMVSTSIYSATKFPASTYTRYSNNAIAMYYMNIV